MNAAGRIGPNAVTRVAEALSAVDGAVAAERVFARAGLLDHLRRPPQAMVPETDVARLHAALRRCLGETRARELARDAGRRTAEYLLAHRIPRPVQALLRRLPAGWAARLLLVAITRHAWTFTGSGQFDARAGMPIEITIRGNPLCRDLVSQAPACDFYAATFEHLFRSLVHPRTTVVETACEACGDDACRFRLGWQDPAA